MWNMFKVNNKGGRKLSGSFYSLNENICFYKKLTVVFEKQLSRKKSFTVLARGTYVAPFWLTAVS